MQGQLNDCHSDFNIFQLEADSFLNMVYSYWWLYLSKKFMTISKWEPRILGIYWLETMCNKDVWKSTEQVAVDEKSLQKRWRRQDSHTREPAT